MTTIDGCDFCAIIRSIGDSKANLIAEWVDAIALSPLHPATAGHFLVVPKQHIADVLELEDPLSAALWAHTLEASKLAQAALTPDGVNIITSAGEAATQSVFHLHFHVLPRYKEDNIENFWPEERIAVEEERLATTKLREALNPTDGNGEP